MQELWYRNSKNIHGKLTVHGSLEYTNEISVQKTSRANHHQTTHSLVLPTPAEVVTGWNFVWTVVCAYILQISGWRGGARAV